MMYMTKPLFKNDFRRPDFPFDEFFRPFPMGEAERPMHVDVLEENDKFVLEAELPGVKKEDIVLEINNDALSISTSVNEEKEEKHEGYICRERRKGTMARRFSLEGIDIDGISASYENGILTVLLPKLEEKKSEMRRIEIA